MEVLSIAAVELVSGLVGFFAWLDIHPSPQDAVKTLLLIVFVLAILMVVGDVYRGEIQNKLHRVILAPSAKGSALPADQRNAFAARRRLRKEKDIVCHLPQTLVPLTMNDIHSDVLFYFRYRDCAGKLRTKAIETYRVRFHVRKNANPQSLAAGHEGDHQYTADEEDQISDEEGRTIITMANSRVDYLQLGKIDPLMEREMARFEALQKKSGLGQMFAGVKGGRVCRPEALGLVTKFHFPIDPHFLLYKHPDTNVRTTAWLTVLTSVFALFMQIIFSTGDTPTNVAQDPVPVVRTVSR